MLCFLHVFRHNYGRLCVCGGTCMFSTTLVYKPTYAIQELCMWQHAKNALPFHTYPAEGGSLKKKKKGSLHIKGWRNGNLDKTKLVKLTRFTHNFVSL